MATRLNLFTASMLGQEGTVAERDLRDRPYAHMTHDEILSEHGRIYGNMTPAERIKYAEERRARIAATKKSREPNLKWKATVKIGLILVLVMGAYWFIQEFDRM
jgi:hypothetical protein